MKREAITGTAVFCGLVALAVAVRLITETPNFGAVTAAALFAGFYFRHRAVAVCVPLLAMTISDQLLGGYDKFIMVVVYGSMLIPIAWNPLLRARLTPARVGLTAAISSVSFYLLTNAAVWYVWYPHTLAQLAHSYARALPFAVNTLASDLTFSGLLFGAYALAAARQSASVPALAEVRS